MEVSMRFADEDLPEIKSGLYELEIEVNTGCLLYTSDAADE